MAKVKKTAAVTGVRNVKASKKKDATAKPARVVAKPGIKAKAERTRKTKASKTKASKTKASKTRAKSMSNVKSISKARAKAGKARIQAPAPAVRFVVKPLEPQAKCGAGTSVQYLFKVDQTGDGKTTAHLVFFDRHGWYCEHGRNCPAVEHAKKYQGHIARAS